MGPCCEEVTLLCKAEMGKYNGHELSWKHPASLKCSPDRRLPRETASVAMVSWCWVCRSGAVTSLSVAIWVCPSVSQLYPLPLGDRDTKWTLLLLLSGVPTAVSFLAGGDSEAILHWAWLKSNWTWTWGRCPDGTLKWGRWSQDFKLPPIFSLAEYWFFFSFPSTIW